MTKMRNIVAILVCLTMLVCFSAVIPPGMAEAGGSSVAFSDDFEYEDSLSNHGWTISGGNPYAIVDPQDGSNRVAYMPSPANGAAPGISHSFGELPLEAGMQITLRFYDTGENGNNCDVHTQVRFDGGSRYVEVGWYNNSYRFEYSHNLSGAWSGHLYETYGLRGIGWHTFTWSVSQTGGLSLLVDGNVIINDSMGPAGVPLGTLSDFTANGGSDPYSYSFCIDDFQVSFTGSAVLNVSPDKLVYAAGDTIIFSGSLATPLGAPVSGVQIGIDDPIAESCFLGPTTDGSGTFAYQIQTKYDSDGIYVFAFYSAAGTPAYVAVAVLGPTPSGDLQLADTQSGYTINLGGTNDLSQLDLAVSTKDPNSTVLPNTTPEQINQSLARTTHYMTTWGRNALTDFVSNPLNDVAVVYAVGCTAAMGWSGGGLVACVPAYKYLVWEFGKSAAVGLIETAIENSTSMTDTEKASWLEAVRVGKCVVGLVELDPVKGLVPVLGSAWTCGAVVSSIGDDSLTLIAEPATSSVNQDSVGIVVLQLPSSVSTATGSGTATFNSDKGTIQDLTAISVNTLPTPPVPGLVFPDGLFSCNISGLPVGGTVTVTITLPSGIPANGEYWKYDYINGWYEIPYTVVSANTIQITLTDGGTGDSDGIANGAITDPGGLGVPSPGPVPPVPEFPTVLLLGVGLVGMAGVAGFVLYRRRRLARQ